MRVYKIEEIADFMKEQEVDIAVLTIPKAEAVKVSKQLIDHGIRAIWNFAHVDLDVPDNVVVENVHLSESLMRLSYNLANVSGQE